MRPVSPVAAACLLAISCTAGVTDCHNGDLLFFAPAGQHSNMEVAINAATADTTALYTHVAIIEVDSKGHVYTIDASPKYGVSRHTLKQTVRDNTGKDGIPPTMSLYRLRDTSFCLAGAVDRAKSYIGLPYDFTFYPDNDAVYCSELIWLSYLDTNGKHIFDTIPMNFLDSDGKLPAYWVELFDHLGIPVPQGVRGTNPVQLSRSPLLYKVCNMH